MGRDYLRRHDPGWYVFPLSLGRTLLAADALTNARLLVEVASQVIEACINLNLMPAAQGALESYRALEGEIRKRLDVSVSELAWELHKEGCRQEHPNFRAELAALLWTLGTCRTRPSWGRAALRATGPRAPSSLESFRCAGLWFWLRAAPPARDGVRTEHLTLRTSKPMHYRYYTPPPTDSRNYARRGVRRRPNSTRAASLKN